MADEDSKTGVIAEDGIEDKELASLIVDMVVKE